MAGWHGSRRNEHFSVVTASVLLVKKKNRRKQQEFPLQSLFLIWFSNWRTEGKSQPVSHISTIPYETLISHVVLSQRGQAGLILQLWLDIFVSQRKKPATPGKRLAAGRLGLRDVDSVLSMLYWGSNQNVSFPLLPLVNSQRAFQLLGYIAGQRRMNTWCRKQSQYNFPFWIWWQQFKQTVYQFPAHVHELSFL